MLLRSRVLLPKRHKCHLRCYSADLSMTATMTHDTSIRHPSYLVSYRFPRDSAERDTYDALRTYVAGNDLSFEKVGQK